MEIGNSNEKEIAKSLSGIVSYYTNYFKFISSKVLL